MVAVTGDKVQILTDHESYEGTLMPDNKEFVIIKLASGYNVGVSKIRIKEVKVIQAHTTPKEAKGQTQDSKENAAAKLAGSTGLPIISILHTGGTIASKVDYDTGAVFAQFSPEELVNMFPELKTLATIRSRLIRQMWSEDIRFSHYNILCKEVIQEVKNGAHAVLITHGTDTLHMTSAALAFMLQHCPIPVILVGAQRSSDRASSDAAWNLLSAVTFVTSTNFAEVGICMHENLHDENCVILPATKTRKMHSSRRDAFKPINTTAWARVNPKTREIHFFKTDYHARQTTAHLPFRPFKEDLKVGMIKMHTNMYAAQYSLYKGWDGLVLEGSGIAGNIPINEIDEYTKEHTAIYKVVQELTKTGTIVIATTQTLYGSINMNVYSTGRKMQDAGILGNFCDMLPETAFIKLAWLLSNYDKKEVQELLCMNLVGEISSRIEVQDHEQF